MISQNRIVEIVAEHFHCDTETIYKGFSRRAMLMRQIAILFCRNIGCYRNFEVAGHFKQAPTTVSMSYLAIKEKLKKDEHFGNYKIKLIVKNVYAKLLEEIEKDPDVNIEAAKTVKARVASSGKSENPA